MGKVFSLNINGSVKEAVFVKGAGVEGDDKASLKKSGVSLLTRESLSSRKNCPRVEGSVRCGLHPGDFSETVTTEDIDLSTLSEGDIFSLGEEVKLRLTRKGRKCYKYCSIYSGKEDCLIPTAAIFAEVIRGGKVRVGNSISTGKRA